MSAKKAKPAASTADTAVATISIELFGRVENIRRRVRMKLLRFYLVSVCRYTDPHKAWSAFVNLARSRFDGLRTPPGRYRGKASPALPVEKRYARGEDRSRAQRRLAGWMRRSRLGATCARTEGSGAAG